MSYRFRHASRAVLLLASAALAAPAARAQEPAQARPAAAGRPAQPRLLEGLGTHSRRIATRVPEAQRWFDQGLRLTYAFNHAEAITAFERAAELDSTCAMCQWGIAFALGPNINAPMDSASAVRAYEAVRRAQLLAANAPPVERVWVAALARRYAPAPTANRAALDSAFARAMQDVAAKHPNDLDAAVIAAEATMDLSPWNYWTKDLAPRPETRRVVASLEKVLARNPDHPGVCHYYIHAVEAAYPRKAVRCAERLAALMPGAGHLVHMPGHIYIRVGRYADAIRANEHAVHADETYLQDRPRNALYPGFYYPHNYHFMAFAAMLAGDEAKAVEAARTLARNVQPPLARQFATLQTMAVYPSLMLVTFGRMDEALAEPLPPADQPLSVVMAHYARGVALASKGRTQEAAAALDSLQSASARVRAWNDPTAVTVSRIAGHALAGRLASERGDHPAAVRELRAAAAIEDAMPYMEPPEWYAPVRWELGRALLRAGDRTAAARAYQEDLARFPENGRSKAGLAEARAAR